MKYLSTVSVFGMRTGNTTVLCEAAKKIGAAVLCHSAEEAKRVAKEYEVDTIHFGQFPLRGSHQPIMVDTHAMAVYALGMEKEVADLEHDLVHIRQQLEEINMEYAGFREKVEREKAKLNEQK